MKNIQAFPRPYSKDDYGDYPVACREQDGMTLRDYFAGQALIGCLLQDGSDRERYATAFARDAYRIADAMMQERDK